MPDPRHLIPSVTALATVGLGLALTLTCAAAEAAPASVGQHLEASRHLTVTQDGGASPDCVTVLRSSGPREPTDPLLGPRAGPLPAVCGDVTQDGGAGPECVPLQRALGPQGPADPDAPNFPLLGPRTDPATACDDELDDR